MADALAAEKAAAERLTFARRRLVLGDVGAFEVAEMQRLHDEARIAAVSARVALYSDVISMMQAVGSRVL